jgi:hypothetical protein
LHAQGYLQYKTGGSVSEDKASVLLQGGGMAAAGECSSTAVRLSADAILHATDG